MNRNCLTPASTGLAVTHEGSRQKRPDRPLSLAYLCR
jgi:hypothetical protein